MKNLIFGLLVASLGISAAVAQAQVPTAVKAPPPQTFAEPPKVPVFVPPPKAPPSPAFAEPPKVPVFVPPPQVPSVALPSAVKVSPPLSMTPPPSATKVSPPMAFVPPPKATLPQMVEIPKGPLPSMFESTSKALPSVVAPPKVEQTPKALPPVVVSPPVPTVTPPSIQTVVSPVKVPPAQQMIEVPKGLLGSMFDSASKALPPKVAIVPPPAFVPPPKVEQPPKVLPSVVVPLMVKVYEGPNLEVVFPKAPRNVGIVQRPDGTLAIGFLP